MYVQYSIYVIDLKQNIRHQSYRSNQIIYFQTRCLVKY